MKISQLGVFVVAASVIAGVVVVSSVANAQQPPQAGPQGFPGQGGFGQQGMSPMQMMGGGGQMQVVNDGANLFIVGGGRVVRVDKAQMKVTGECPLMRPMPMQPGAGGFGGGGGETK